VVRRIWRRRRDIVCREAVALVTDYLEGALSRADRARFEAHLRDCEHCSEYLHQIRTTIQVVGRVEPETLDLEVRNELIGLYRRWQAS
jgi:anti-sigma factor RsiW